MREFMKIVMSLLLASSVTVVVAQNDVVSPGDNLVVEGIPKIPLAMAEEINRYTEFRYAALSNWHPTKREMLISTRFADTSQIHLVTFPGGARTQLTFFRDSAGSASYQPTHGNYFVFSKGIGGNENYQKYRYDFGTGAITLLTDGKSRNTGGAWSNAGNWYAYESTRRNGEDVDLTQSMSYKGMMLSGMPNMAFTIGYTNASWTLKADLVSEFVCRVLNYMDAKGFDTVEPQHPGNSVDERPLMDFTPGYVLRALDYLPKAGHVAPWRLKQNYLLDLRLIRRGKVDDEALEFTKHRAPVTASA